VKKFYPDFRGTLNALQSYSASGKIDTGILLNQQDALIGQLIEHVKARDFILVRKWIGSNADMEINTVLQLFYDKAVTLFELKCVPSIILILSKYQYQASQVADMQIQLAACMVEIIMEASWK
jgi:replication factor C small subunit